MKITDKCVFRYNEVNGDLIQLAKAGKFDVIVHGCNCMSVMGAGIAPKMAMTFGCDRFEMERWGATIEKLGCIDFQTFVLGENAMWSLEDAKNNRNEPELTVVNAYTQYYPRVDLRPFDYEAFTVVCRKLNIVFKDKHIGLPQIGAGLAGGDWNRIKEIIQRELTNCEVTVVIFNKQ